MAAKLRPRPLRRASTRAARALGYRSRLHRGVDAAVAAAGGGLEVIAASRSPPTHRTARRTSGYCWITATPGCRCAGGSAPGAVRSRTGDVAKLETLGLTISGARPGNAGADEGGAVGRPHVARALEELGYVKSRRKRSSATSGEGARVRRVREAHAGRSDCDDPCGRRLAVLAHRARSLAWMPTCAG